jgi:acetyl esterase/lipase
MRRLRTSEQIVALGTALIIGAACRVNDPEPGQTIPTNQALDRRPAGPPIDYHQPGSRWRKLDVYLPPGARSSVALIYLHSGGWSGGDKRSADEQPIPQYFIARGHIVFSANYTLTENGLSAFPANIDDVKWAIAWANQPSTKARYGYSKVVVMGTSAGGQLAALATTTGDKRPADMPGSMNVRPDGGIAFAAPIDMTSWGAQGSDAQRAVQRAFFQGFWGSAYTAPEQVPMLARVAASPHAFVDPSDPPIYLGSGNADDIALPQYNADVLEQRYRDVGGGDGFAWNDVIEAAPNNGHNVSYGVNIAAVQSFLDSIAKP